MMRMIIRISHTVLRSTLLMSASFEGATQETGAHQNHDRHSTAVIQFTRSARLIGCSATVSQSNTGARRPVAHQPRQICVMQCKSYECFSFVRLYNLYTPTGSIGVPGSSRCSYTPESQNQSKSMEASGVRAKGRTRAADESVTIHLSRCKLCLQRRKCILKCFFSVCSMLFEGRNCGSRSCLGCRS